MKKTTKYTLRYYWKKVKKYKTLAIFLHIALIIGVTANMIWPILFSQFIDIASSATDKSLVANTLLLYILYFFIIEVVSVTGHRAAAYMNDAFQPKVMKDIYDDCFKYMQQHSYDFFSNNFTGSLVKKVSKMARAFESIADRVTWEISRLIVRVLVIIGVFLYIKPILGYILIGWTISFIALNYKLAVFKMKYDIAEAKAATKVIGQLADTITNTTNIKLFAGLKDEHKWFKKITHDWRVKVKKAWNISSHIELFQAVLMVSIEIVVFYVAVRLWQQDIISVGDFVLIMIYIFELFNQLWDFGRMIRDIFKNLADAEEMSEIFMKKHAIKDKNKKKIKIKSGKIEFKDVNFSYQDDDNVINNLNLTIKQSEKIALIGPSGGGKSTIVKLILRLFDVTSGAISIDNQNIAHYTQDSLHEQVTLVPQDPILFHRTIMDNIRYGRRDASDKEVMAAAKLAHCHEFISTFSKGYETYVGERGVKLSGGQRQRVAIARAILSNAKILILDEATSSLDSEAETLIQDALQNLIKHKTTIIIAHRLSTIMKTDRILVLKEGQILEEGTHADLVDKNNSLYKKLWDLQVGGYL